MESWPSVLPFQTHRVQAGTDLRDLLLLSPCFVGEDKLGREVTPVHAAGFSHCAVLSKILHGWSLFGGPSHMGPGIPSCCLSYRLSKTPSHWGLAGPRGSHPAGHFTAEEGHRGDTSPTQTTGDCLPAVCEPGLRAAAVQGSWGEYGLNSQTRGIDGFTSKSGMAFPSGSER